MPITGRDLDNRISDMIDNSIGNANTNPEYIEQMQRLYNTLNTAMEQSNRTLENVVFNQSAQNWGPGAQIPYANPRRPGSIGWCSNCGLRVRGTYLEEDMLLLGEGSAHNCKTMNEIRLRRDADRWPYNPSREEAEALGIAYGDPIWCVFGVPSTREVAQPSTVILDTLTSAADAEPTAFVADPAVTAARNSVARIVNATGANPVSVAELNGIRMRSATDAELRNWGYSIPERRSNEPGGMF